MSNKYARRWELNSTMLRYKSRIDRRKQLIQMGAHDADRLEELNEQAQRKYDLAKAEYGWWHLAYTLEHFNLIRGPRGLGWERPTRDAVVVELRLAAIERLAMEHFDDREYAEAVLDGLQVYITALISYQAMLERKLI